MVEAQSLVELNEGSIQKYWVSLVLDIHLPKRAPTGVLPKRAQQSVRLSGTVLV